MNVSWESKGLPRELEQRGAPGPAPNPWTLALTLPLSQPSPSVTCVVSSLVDQKSATRDLGEVCVHKRETRPHGQAGAAHLGAILGALVVMLLILGAGLYLLFSRGKRKSLETGRGRCSSPSSAHTPPSLTDPQLPPLHFAAQGMSLQEAGAGSQEKPRDHGGGVHEAMQVSRDGRDKGLEEPHLEQERPISTVYTEVPTPGQVRIEI
ncbi:uncharacterized protein LOC144216325 [Crocuta crocuta]